MTKSFFDRMPNADKLEAARGHLKVAVALRMKNGQPEDQPESIYEGTVRYYERLVAEELQLRGLTVPASFSGQVPDTPEAAAARRQLEIAGGKNVPARPVLATPTDGIPKTSGGGNSWQVAA
ncbi:MAG TPA: hypothetical protein VGK74_22360 [Symbiobacteriaceae bacterium]|jgi:hypothetical protein